MLKIRVEVLKLTNLHLGGSNRVFLLFSGSQQFQFLLVGHSSFLLVPGCTWFQVLVPGTWYHTLRDIHQLPLVRYEIPSCLGLPGTRYRSWLVTR